MTKPDGQLAPGAEVTDRFVVVRLLGSGGLGAVYEVEHKFTKHHRALKVLHPKFRGDKDVTERFLKEASAAGRIGNPHIVETFDAGLLPDGSPYLVMELITGKPLNEVLRWNGRLDVGLAAELMMQACSALQAAHEAEIVHRDLKPANLFVAERDGGGFMKVLDFGVSKFGGDDLRQTQSGVTMGTPLYMAPEQLRGAKNADARSDVYSLGVILFEMLSGHVPFAADSFAELAVKVLSSERPALAVRSGAVPAELDSIVKRALNVDPAARFQSAADFKAALQPFAHNHAMAELLRDHVSAPQQAPWGDTHPRVTPPPETAGKGELSATALSGKTTARRASLGPLVAVGAVAVVAAAYVLWPHPAPAPKSIAVLPFENLSQEPDSDYLATGIAESVTYLLSRSTSLKVTPRSSASRARTMTASPTEAGAKLQVDVVLAGELGPRGVVSAELIDVKTGALLWGDRFDRSVKSPEVIQEALAEAVREKLEGRRAAAAPMPRTSKDPEAFNLYLKGRWYWNKRTAESLAQAAELFQQAVTRDDGFALAWVGLGDSVALMEQYAGAPAKETCPRAMKAISTALGLDPNLATARASHALLLGHCEHAWREAEAEFEKAISLDANYATAHHWYSLHLAYRGLFERGLRQAREASRLDPLSLIAVNAVSVVNAGAGRWDEVLAHSERLIALDASFPVGYIWKGRALRLKGRYPEAAEALQKAFVLGGEKSLEVMGDLAANAALQGKAEESTQWVKRLEEHGAPAAIELARVAAARGDVDGAFEKLDQALEAGSWFLVQLKIEPLFEPLRKDPRFAERLKRVNLDDSTRSP